MTDPAAFAALVEVAKANAPANDAAPPEVALSPRRHRCLGSGAVRESARGGRSSRCLASHAAGRLAGCCVERKQSARRFLAEGRQATSEALRRPGTVIELLVADDSVDRHGDLLTAASEAEISAAAPARAMPSCLRR